MRVQTELQIRITRGQHGGEPRHFLLAATALARLFKVPMIAHFLERAFAVDFFLQSPQRLLNWFAFFELNFRQSVSLPSNLRGCPRAIIARFGRHPQGRGA